MRSQKDVYFCVIKIKTMENKETRNMQLSQATAEFEWHIKGALEVFMRDASEDSRQSMMNTLRSYVTIYLCESRGFSTTDLICALNKVGEYAK